MYGVIHKEKKQKKVNKKSLNRVSKNNEERPCMKKNKVKKREKEYEKRKEKKKEKTVT